MDEKTNSMGIKFFMKHESLKSHHHRYLKFPCTRGLFFIFGRAMHIMFYIEYKVCMSRCTLHKLCLWPIYNKRVTFGELKMDLIYLLINEKLIK
jgi:hypothetical protein